MSRFMVMLRGLWIHGWTGEKGVKGKFKFLSVSVVNAAKRQKIPLISVPVSKWVSLLVYC